MTEPEKVSRETRTVELPWTWWTNDTFTLPPPPRTTSTVRAPLPRPGERRYGA